MFSLLLFLQALSFIIAMSNSNGVTKPIIECTSLDDKHYKCEWTSAINTSYTFQYWNSAKTSLISKTPHYMNDTGKQVVYDKTYDPVLSIMVNATKDNQTVTATKEFDLYASLKPNVSCGVPCITTTNTSATLKWVSREFPHLFETDSNVAYQLEDEIEKTEENDIIKGRGIYTVKNLKPARLYKFFVRSRYRFKYFTSAAPFNYSDWTYLTNGTTKESRPSDTVQNLTIGHNRITWNEIPKESQNGEIKGYTVTMNGSSVATSEKDYKIEDGYRYIGYNVCVSAYNSDGNSPDECITIDDSIMGSPDKITTLPPAPSSLPKNSNLTTVLIIVTIVLVVIILTIIIYIKLEKKRLFIKWPEPRYPKTCFNEVAHFPPNTEVFDDLRQKTLTTVNDEESIRMGNNNILQTPNITEDVADNNVPLDTDEPSTPLIYQLVGEENKNCIRVDAEVSMPYISNTIGVLTDSKCPPKQTEDYVDRFTVIKKGNENLFLMNNSSSGYTSLTNFCPAKETSVGVKSDKVITRAEVTINEDQLSNYHSGNGNCSDYITVSDMVVVSVADSPNPSPCLYQCSDINTSFLNIQSLPTDNNKDNQCSEKDSGGNNVNCSGFEPMSGTLNKNISLEAVDCKFNGSFAEKLLYKEIVDNQFSENDNGDYSGYEHMSGTLNKNISIEVIDGNFHGSVAEKLSCKDSVDNQCSENGSGDNVDFSGYEHMSDTLNKSISIEVTDGNSNGSFAEKLSYKCSVDNQCNGSSSGYHSMSGDSINIISKEVNCKVPFEQTAGSYKTTNPSDTKGDNSYLCSERRNINCKSESYLDQCSDNLDIVNGNINDFLATILEKSFSSWQTDVEAITENFTKEHHKASETGPSEYIASEYLPK